MEKRKKQQQQPKNNEMQNEQMEERDSDRKMSIDKTFLTDEFLLNIVFAENALP